MGSQTAPRFSQGIRAQTQKVNKAVVVGEYGRKNLEAKLGHKRLDKLLQDWKDEKESGKNFSK